MSGAGLKITNLTIWSGKQKIIDQLDLTIANGEQVALFGANGAGKTSLLQAIMGIGDYKIKGEIGFNGVDLLKLSIDRRARAGLGLFFQDPPTVKNLKTGVLAAHLPGNLPTDLHVEKFLSRGLNVGLSGGEKKRLELAQLMGLNPQFWLIDEIDSGVDQDNLVLIGTKLRQSLINKSALLVSHNHQIFNFLNVNRAIVLKHGRIVADDKFTIITDRLKRGGYGQF
ncbi:MAG: ATP-binding cassette domain-containing protein [Candidatus Saccharibacteria bacterium]|nr:ATP-binding cassette domain-containing protein [Candidatus Saccharibacteria bacterium]